MLFLFYRDVDGVASFSTTVLWGLNTYVSRIKFINPKSTVTHAASLSFPHQDTQLRLPFSYSMIDVVFVLTHTSYHFAVY